MAKKFQNRYRIESSRATWWDYSWSGAYFITICTKNRRHYFGQIINGAMVLSKQGILADIFWHEITNHAPNAALGAFVVMPNHIHGILILKKSQENHGGINERNLVDSNNDTGDVANRRGNNAETRHALSLRSNDRSNDQKRFRNQGKNTVSSILGGYKAAVTKHANRLGLEFGWQARFDDRIIRNDEAYQRIQNYIWNNPRNWKGDCFFEN